MRRISGIEEKNTRFKARRWVMEACHSWLSRFRKLLAKHEKKGRNYQALVAFACAVIIWRNLIPIHPGLIPGQVLSNIRKTIHLPDVTKLLLQKYYFADGKKKRYSDYLKKGVKFPLVIVAVPLRKKARRSALLFFTAHYVMFFA